MFKFRFNAAKPSGGKQASSPPPSKPGGRIWVWTYVHCTVFLLSLSCLMSVGIGVLLYLFVTLDLPSLGSLKHYRPPVTAEILDRHGEVVERLSSCNRYLIPFASMPPLLPQAFVAAEDARFYQHPGVDAWSIARALVNNLRTGVRGQGGSTITQQVARDLLLTPEKTYLRKIKEAVLAYRIDHALAKEEILHIYLNQIYLGEGAYGVEAAARTYFGKHVRNLNLAEIAILAGLPQAPSRYSPLKHYQRAKRRQAYVLNRMVEEGFVTPTAARNAYRHPLLWAPHEREQPANRYFLQQVRNYIDEKYGKQALTEDGLTVETTLDQALQLAAANSLTNGLDHWASRQGKGRNATRPQAALIAMDVASGQVRAMMGGSSFDRSQYNRASQARRQPGSAFKPIIYAAALASGLTPATIINDAPLSLPGAVPGKAWEPHNFENDFLGPTTLRDGLVYSRNIVAIKLLQQVGIARVISLARQLGIHSPLAANLSLALGSSGVSLVEMTAAYAVLGNGGRMVRPVFIKRILDRDGKVMEEAPHTADTTAVIDARTAYQITHIMQGVIQDGTGQAAQGLPVAAAGKTGTTDNNVDAWFIGYTPDVVAGVWLGFDQKRSLGRGETGGRAAAPVWRDFMGRLSKEYLKHASFPTPDGIVFAPVTQSAAHSPNGGAAKVIWEPFRQDQPPWGGAGANAAAPAAGTDAAPPPAAIPPQPAVPATDGAIPPPDATGTEAGPGGAATAPPKKKGRSSLLCFGAGRPATMRPFRDWLVGGLLGKVLQFVLGLVDDVEAVAEGLAQGVRCARILGQHPYRYLFHPLGSVFVGGEDTDHPRLVLAQGFHQIGHRARGVGQVEHVLDGAVFDAGAVDEGAEYVGFAEEPGEMAFLVRHRQAGDLALQHDQRRLFQGIVAGEGERGRGHHVLDLHLREQVVEFVDVEGSRLGGRCVLDVTISDDANQFTV